MTSWFLATTQRAARMPFLREFLGFGSSTIAEQGSRLMTALVAAAILGPAVWGYWFLLNLILQYGTLFHLGAVNGMNREVPAAMGRGEPGESEALRRSALGFLGISLAAAVVIVVVMSLLLGEMLPLRDVAAALALLAAQQLFTFAITSLKARTEFGSVSRLQFVSALVYPAVVIPATFLWLLPGFMLGQALAYFLLAVAAARGTKGMYRPVVDWPRSRRLIAIGFPIMLVGVVFALFATVDRWVVAAHLDAAALGHYALALMALGAVGLLPRVISQQVYPRMAFAWAAHGDVDEMTRLVRRQRIMALVITTALCLPLAAVAPWMIRTFLPAYVPGVAPLLVTLAIPIVSSVGRGYGNVLNVLGLQVWYLAFIVVATGVNLALSLALVGPFGLVGVALGSLGGYAFMAGCLVVAGTVVFRRLRAAPRRQPSPG